jgi:hypothetical protein
VANGNLRAGWGTERIARIGNKLEVNRDGKIGKHSRQGL